jgi:hypothetical protein
MKRTTLGRNVIPAVIVALVLASSFIISAGAKQTANHDKDQQCGYGYTQADKDENGTEPGQNNDTKSHGDDNDRCEDEQVGEDNGGDNGGGGDAGVVTSAAGADEAANDRAGGR